MPLNLFFLEDGRKRFVQAQCKHSDLSEAFWTQIADIVFDGRKTICAALKLGNYLVPVGKWCGTGPAMEFLVDRNNRGIALEKRGEVDAAMMIYEVSVADMFFGTQPYDRLRIQYTKRGLVRDAARVCKAYLALPERAHGQSKEKFREHLRKLESKFRAKRT